MRTRDGSALWGECVERNARYWERYHTPAENDVERGARWQAERIRQAELRSDEWRIFTRAATEALHARYGLATALIMSPYKSPQYVDARRAVMCALYDVAGLTMEQVGVAMGRHYATVSIGVANARIKRGEDAHFRGMCELVDQSVRGILNG